MSTPKQSRRKTASAKLEPIDWREFANDAVLNGNMSTLYHRPASEDPTAYASPEALLEIRRRAGLPPQSADAIDFDCPESDTESRPTVGVIPVVGITEPPQSNEASIGNFTEPSAPTAGRIPAVLESVNYDEPAGGSIPAVGLEHPVQHNNQASSPTPVPTDTARPTVRLGPAVGFLPTVGLAQRRRTKPIRDVQDALTLAGQVLYKAMYGVPDGTKSKSCTKGYRQLAAETHLDKDTVRDLICEFKEKGIVRETGTYDSDTRSAKTYEVLSYKTILQMWRDAGLVFVTAGRTRPTFCTQEGEPLAFRPTVGTVPTAQPSRGKGSSPTVGPLPTVGSASAALVMAGSQASHMTQDEPLRSGELIQVLQQITGGPVDLEAADRLMNNCRTVAADCTIEEIVEFAWSKAFLCRSGKIENPVGFLITQVPKHFQGEALQAYREKKRKELAAAAETATHEEEQRREDEREAAELEELHQVRIQIAERHRKEQGIDLEAVLQDSEADAILKEWAKRMLKLRYRYQPRYI